MRRREVRLAVTAALVGAVALTGCGEDIPPEPHSPPYTTAAAEPSSPAATDVATTGQETSDPPQEPVEQDPELAELLAGLIVEELPPLSLLAVDDVVTHCGTEAGGCYVAEEATIYVTSEWTDFRRPELLAHEYLHHVWDRDGLGDDAALTEALDLAWSDADGLGALVPTWQEDYVEPDGSILPTELFSYACTGLRTEQLEPTVAEQCQRYLNMSALPVAQAVDPETLLGAVDELRQADGLEPLERNQHATKASQARAATFTPVSQTPLDEYPEAVKRHLDAGCTPARYGAHLTRPSEPAQMVADLDALLQGALSGTEFTGIGMDVKPFLYIDATQLFGERTLRVNATLVVVTVCG